MKNRALLFALLYLSFLYYEQRVSMVNQPVRIISNVFYAPRVVHESIPQGYQYVYHKYLQPGSSVFLGKFKWRDSLNIPVDIWDYEKNTDDLVYDFVWRGKGDNFKTDGFQLVPDYNSTVFYSNFPAGTIEGQHYWTYYPMYLVNQTTETRYFIFKRNAVSAIQEAMDLENDRVDTWWPIEFNNISKSNEGLRALKVYPGEFVLFIMPRYMGPVLSKLRVRLQNGDNIIVSNSFDGHFYPSQFMTDPEDNVHAVIETNDINSIQYMFLGGLPKEKELARS